MTVSRVPVSHYDIIRVTDSRLITWRHGMIYLFSEAPEFSSELITIIRYFMGQCFSSVLCRTSLPATPVPTPIIHVPFSIILYISLGSLQGPKGFFCFCLNGFRNTLRNIRIRGNAKPQIPYDMIWSLAKPDDPSGGRSFPRSTCHM